MSECPVDRLVALFMERKYNEEVKRLVELRPNEWYVTELTRCRQWVLFSRFYGPSKLMKPALMLGELAHMGLQMFLAEGYGESEVEANKQVGDYVVKGRCDAIVDGVVYELKTCRAVPQSPLPHHVLQLRLYLWLFERQQGVLLYVAPDGVVSYNVECPLDDQQVLELIEMPESPRWPEWECSYCEFSQYCGRAVRGERHGKR
ncbi:MAG: hypothetical protein DRJ18_00615 [Candidatus Methanomethylicota archaeon]|nr:MAG: hypothetical protein DRJ18_00615 [Candidatus Verstraetearchaeota archaeon]